MVQYLVIAIVLLALLLLYFRIADRLNITDKPKERSSHSYIAIRGGGIVFLVAIMIAGFMQPYYWIPVLGVLIIGVVSFTDDRISLSSRVRFLFHLIAASLMFVALGMFGSAAPCPLWIIPFLYILVIGIINAYNFMDGINGITGLYSLVVLGGLQYVNLRQVPFIEPDMIWLPMISCVVFLFFNLRKKAKCFAGDVGSVTMAFWVMFLLLKLIFVDDNWMYLVFLTVYGVDTVLTILHRLWLRQNIFEAHRLHFYQILANERRVSHIIVSFGYAIVQAVMILFIIHSSWSPIASAALILLLPGILYLLAKPYLMKHPIGR